MVTEPFSVTELEVNGPGGIVYCTTPTTNGTATVTIAGDGTGKPTLNLTNAAQSCSLEVTANNEMTIAGALNNFKFDVSSAVGGITFPDSTVQTTAAAGGSGPSIGSNQSIQCIWSGATQQWICLNEASYGWADSDTITTSNDVSWYKVGQELSPGVYATAYYPIYFQNDITIDYVSMITAGTAATNDCAIFASDADNFPTGAPILSFSITPGSTTSFDHTETSVAATAFSAGLHFLAIEGTGATFRILGNTAAGIGAIDTSSSSYSYAPAVTPFCSYSINSDSLTTLTRETFSYYLQEDTLVTIPATITLGNLMMGGTDRDRTNNKGAIIPGLFVRSST